MSSISFPIPYITRGVVNRTGLSLESLEALNSYFGNRLIQLETRNMPVVPGDSPPQPDPLAGWEGQLKPSVFRGLITDNAFTFIDKFLSYCVLNNIQDDVKKIRTFSLFLSGAAFDWFQLLGSDSKQSWQAVEKEFRSRYASKDDFALTTAFHARHQLQNESVQTFIDEIMSMGLRLGKKDLDCMSQILQGLKPSHRRFCLSRGYDSLRSLIEAARLSETLGYIEQ